MSAYDTARAAIQASEANWRIAHDIWWEALDAGGDMQAADALIGEAEDAHIATLKVVEAASPDGPLHVLLLQQRYIHGAEL